VKAGETLKTKISPFRDACRWNSPSNYIEVIEWREMNPDKARY
jgi:hypothetical protein